MSSNLSKATLGTVVFTSNFEFIMYCLEVVTDLLNSSTLRFQPNDTTFTVTMQNCEPTVPINI